MSTVATESFRVGDWHVEPTLGRISAGHQVLTLRPREMDLLVYLARHHGAVVTADDLIENVWTGVSVTNDSLYFSISQLRKALDRDGGDTSHIETIPKRGYRLTRPVEGIGGAPGEPAELPESHEAARLEGGPPPNQRSFSIPTLVWPLVAAAFVVVLILVAKTPNETETLPPVAASLPVNAVAVMPFIDLIQGTDYTYFSDGITAEIINRLARIRGLQVVARTSVDKYKDTELDIVQIGQELGVGTILEGSVRKEGDRVRISVQLINAVTGFQVWSDTYERELSSVFDIQDEISKHIADALQLKLNDFLVADEGEQKPAASAEAVEEYLLGLEAFRTSSFEALAGAIGHFEKALEVDPLLMPARVALADTKLMLLNTGASYDQSLIDEAESLIRDVLAAEPNDAAAHRVMGLVHQWRGEWSESEAELARALELAPSDSQAMVQLSDVQAVQGNFENSLQLLGRAVRFDPFGSSVLMKFGNAQQRVGLFDEARESFERSIRANPANPNNTWMLGKLQVADLGELAVGLQSFLRSAESDPRDYEIAAYVGMTYLSLDMVDEAMPWIQRAAELGPDSVTTHALEAVYHAQAGDDARAAEVAQQAITERSYRFGTHSMITGSLIIIAVNYLIENGQADEAVALLENAGQGRADKDIGANRNMQDDQRLSEEFLLAFADIPRRRLIALAAAYRADGRQEMAAQALEKAVVGRLGAVNDFREEMRNEDYLVEAEARAVEGDMDGALDMLEEAVDANLYFNWQIRLMKNYAFRALRGEPRFVDLLQRIRSKIDAERAMVSQPARLLTTALL